MKKLILFSLLIVSCGPYEPDYVDSSGKEYTIIQHCIKSHTETDYGYHYGYNIMEGKTNWHYGMESKTICDEYELDTVEINLKEKYYKAK